MTIIFQLLQRMWAVHLVFLFMSPKNNYHADSNVESCEATIF